MIKVLLQILAHYGVERFLVLGIGTGKVENSEMCEGLSCLVSSAHWLLLYCLLPGHLLDLCSRRKCPSQSDVASWAKRSSVRLATMWRLSFRDGKRKVLQLPIKCSVCTPGQRLCSLNKFIELGFPHSMVVLWLGTRWNTWLVFTSHVLPIKQNRSYLNLWNPTQCEEMLILGENCGNWAGTRNRESHLLRCDPSRSGFWKEMAHAIDWALKIRSLSPLWWNGEGQGASAYVHISGILDHCVSIIVLITRKNLGLGRNYCTRGNMESNSKSTQSEVKIPNLSSTAFLFTFCVIFGRSQTSPLWVSVSLSLSRG